MAFKDNLKKIRTECDITQEELAKYLNVTRPTIAGYEARGKEPDYKTLIMISDYFHVSIDYLLTGQDYSGNINNVNTDEEYKRDLIQEINQKISILSESELEKLLDYTEYLLYERTH
ncbi:MAG: helix-turn-helix transcriptional regulator [Lachnospiraceae bacterium]|nr:helix-turn-helix transcriptional regulator [Lachnospiraceae bacterium]